MIEYLSVDEAIIYVQKALDEETDIPRSAKTVIENAIDLLAIKPVFKYKGYATLFRILQEDDSKESLEVKQVYNITAYFYDISTIFRSDFETFTNFSDLNSPFYQVGTVTLDKLVDSIFITSYYFQVYRNEDGYHEKYIRNSEIEPVNFETFQTFQLSQKLPMFDKDDNAILEPVQIPYSDVYLKVDELKILVDSFKKPSSNATASLISYLNFEQTIKFINEGVESYFEENNLIDLINKKYLEPIVYFEGIALSRPSKEHSLYPQDFDDDDKLDTPFGELGDIDLNDLFKSISIEQKNHVIGYFYPYDALSEIMQFYERGNRFKVETILRQDAIPNSELPNLGINKKGNVFQETPIKKGDFVQLLKYDDYNNNINESPKFEKKDLLFSVTDLNEFLSPFWSKESIEATDSNVKIDSLLKELELKGQHINKLQKENEELKDKLNRMHPIENQGYLDPTNKYFSIEMKLCHDTWNHLYQNEPPRHGKRQDLVKEFLDEYPNVEVTGNAKDRISTVTQPKDKLATTKTQDNF